MLARMVWGTFFLVKMGIFFTRGGDKSYLENAQIDGAPFMKVLPLTTCVENSAHEGDQETKILESFGLVLCLCLFSFLTARVRASVECCACPLRRGQPGNNSLSELQTHHIAMLWSFSPTQSFKTCKYRVFFVTGTSQKC